MSLCSMIKKFLNTKPSPVIPVVPPVPPAPPKNYVIDWRAMSSGTGTRGMSIELIEGGWRQFLFEIRYPWTQNLSIAEQIDRFGGDAVLFHLPFGASPYRDYSFFAIKDTMRYPGMEKVTDISEFVDCMVEIGKKRDLIFYLGYYDAMPELVDPNEMWRELEPFIEIRAKLGKNIRLVFDTLAGRSTGDPNIDILIREVKICGFLLGSEAWPSSRCFFNSDPEHWFFMESHLVNFFDPTKNDGAKPWAAYKKDIKGKIIPCLIGAEAATQESCQQLGAAYLKEYGFLASPGYFPELTAAYLNEKALKL